MPMVSMRSGLAWVNAYPTERRGRIDVSTWVQLSVRTLFGYDSKTIANEITFPADSLSGTLIALIPVFTGAALYR